MKGLGASWLHDLAWEDRNSWWVVWILDSRQEAGWLLAAFGWEIMVLEEEKEEKYQR